MPALDTFFCRAKNPGSLLIRGVTWSTWSHCGLVLPGERVIDATAFHGVRERPLADVRAAASEIAFRNIEVSDLAAAHGFARGQVGKPYDWTWAAGIGLHREWDEDDAWACSELLEAIVQAGGRNRWANQPNRITPQLAWMAA